MNLIKSLIFTATVLSCTAALAEDGSDRVNLTAQKMRLAQETRVNDPNSEASRLVSTDEKKSAAEQMKKSEG
jgi:hypothetical protein